MITWKKRYGLNCKALFAVTAISCFTFAQNEDKFQIYGFADMAITKYFPEDKAVSRTVDKMDEKTNFSLDHVNLYTSFRPNKHLRFLTELSFQDEPVYYSDTAGMRMMGRVFRTAKLAPTNKAQRGITIFNWGSFSVERALFTVYMNKLLNLSFGKFITPAGVWNVDHGSPVIMTISQPTQYSFAEIFPKSQLGLMEDGKIFIGDADLSYVLYVSSGRNNQSLYKINDLSAGGQLRLNLPLLDEFSFGFSGYTGRVNTKVRFSTYTFNGGVFENKIEDIDSLVYRENVFGGDLRLSKWRTTLQAECNYQHITNHLIDSKPTCGTLAFYVIGSVDVLKKDALTITPYAYYEFVDYNDRDNNPLNNITVMSNGYRKFMGGVNLRAFTNYGVKLEYNFTRLLLKPSMANEDVPGIGAQFYIAF